MPSASFVWLYYQLQYLHVAQLRCAYRRVYYYNTGMILSNATQSQSHMCIIHSSW